MSATEHLHIHPKILYFGTPVVLITTSNPNGTTNITPMSSAWALGQIIVLGLSTAGQGMQNLKRTGECVLNLPDARLWSKVEAIAPTTGITPVPGYKTEMGYRFASDKFALGGFTELASDQVKPGRIAECPLQIEARLVAQHPLHGSTANAPEVLVVQTEAVKVHAHKNIVLPDSNHVDTTQWHPLFYVFRHYFSTGPELGQNFRVEA